MIDRRGLIVAIATSLIVGCALGLIAGVLFARSVMFHHPFEHRSHMGPGRLQDTRSIERELGLTDAQAGRFHDILERARARADSLHEQARAEILEVLTPEQRERWNQMNHRMFPHDGGRHGRSRPDAGGDTGRPPPPDGPR